MAEIVVVGGGFAGLWAALLAVRESEERGAGIAVTLVSRDDWLTLRPRLYEPGPENFRTGLSPILDTVGARFVAVSAELPDGTDLSMRYVVADLALVISF